MTENIKELRCSLIFGKSEHTLVKISDMEAHVKHILLDEILKYIRIENEEDCETLKLTGSIRILLPEKELPF